MQAEDDLLLAITRADDSITVIDYACGSYHKDARYGDYEQLRIIHYRKATNLKEMRYCDHAKAIDNASAIRPTTRHKKTRAHDLTLSCFSRGHATQVSPLIQVVEKIMVLIYFQKVQDIKRQVGPIMTWRLNCKEMKCLVNVQV
jgi:hypothetical protein